jgi:biotin carboxylase
MNTVIIVDPFSSGHMYGKAFIKQGFKCIAILSSKDIPTYLTKSLIESDFIKIYNWDPNIIDELRKMNPIAVVAGTETGVYLTDLLAEKLGLEGNPVVSSGLRRNKYEMQLALAKQGLAYINSILIRNNDEIEKAIEGLSDINKYVVKPINSSGTEGVSMVKGKNAVREKLISAEWNRLNHLGEVNEGFLVQDFIEGPEFVVDLVAKKGNYFVASICKYNKIKLNGCDFVYKDMAALDPDSKQFGEMINYARQAAAALDIKIGPIHMELIDSDKGPIMIEAGARLNGGVAPYLFNHTYYPNLLDVSVACYLDQNLEIFSGKAKLKSFGKVCFLYSSQIQEFIMPTQETLERLKLIPEYLGHEYFISEKQMTPLTIDVFTMPGRFWLCSPDLLKLNQKEEEIRDLLWNYK